MLSDEELRALLKGLNNEVHVCPETVRNYLMELIRGSHENTPSPIDGEDE